MSSSVRQLRGRQRVLHRLLQLWQLVPRKVQLLIIKLVQRNKPLYRWLMFRHVEAQDRADATRHNLPPAELRYRVGASPNADEFLRIGRGCAADIQAALQKVGYELGSFTRILDFGCGCGRTLMHMRSLAPSARFAGTDIDHRAIEWCEQHLDFATFRLSKENPPIDYEAETFDFIYVISVFTHLDEDYQFRWLDELRRIAQPGALLLLTLDSSQAGDKGFAFQRSYERGLFPDWYQNAFHSKKYVFDNFGKYFEVLGYFQKGLHSHQDVVVLRKPLIGPGR